MASPPRPVVQGALSKQASRPPKLLANKPPLRTMPPPPKAMSHATICLGLSSSLRPPRYHGWLGGKLASHWASAIGERRESSSPTTYHARPGKRRSSTRWRMAPRWRPRPFRPKSIHGRASSLSGVLHTSSPLGMSGASRSFRSMLAFRSRLRQPTAPGSHQCRSRPARCRAVALEEMTPNTISLCANRSSSLKNGAQSLRVAWAVSFSSLSLSGVPSLTTVDASSTLAGSEAQGGNWVGALGGGATRGWGPHSRLSSRAT
mmetsp:Transcript_7271/g.16628  ORF Transcript_7271/g.16628 Transcript_7271/m.16628 type:complete len:261 (-) Transcript_7271:608-1390(-)